MTLKVSILVFRIWYHMDKEEQENELAKLSKAIDILPYQH
jgi:hypothetical protein